MADEFLELVNYVGNIGLLNAPENAPVPRRYIRDADNPLEFFNEVQFKMRYRFTKQTVTQLLTTMLWEEPASRRGLPLPITLQLLVTLRFYATASFQTVCGDLRGIHQTSVCRTIKRVSFRLARQMKQHIYFPKTRASAAENRQAFYNIAQFPGVSGSLDCTHIAIQNPGGPYGEVYRNRKRWFSINVQAVSGPRKEVVDLVVRWPGSTHDARIFDNSALRVKLEQGLIDGIILGDGGYPCLPYLLTPLREPRTEPERRYNRAQIATRNVVECMFGLMKRRFPCLKRGLANRLRTSVAVIIACAVLYNIGIRINDDVPEEEFPMRERAVPARNHQLANQGQAAGRLARLEIIRNHFS